MDRVRVAALQCLLRPIRSFDEFRDQVAALVETDADYDCTLVVFPEYSSVQGRRVRVGLVDRTPAFQLRRGFRVIGVVANYLWRALLCSDHRMGERLGGLSQDNRARAIEILPNRIRRHPGVANDVFDGCSRGS